MASPEFRQDKGIAGFSVSPDENSSDFQAKLGQIEGQIEENEANENIIEREQKWEQLIEEKDVLMDEFEQQNQGEF